MHTASSGQDVSSQPWMVQYPPGCDTSHDRVPFGLQSAAAEQSSPIIFLQPPPAVATTASTINIRSAAAGWNIAGPVCTLPAPRAQSAPSPTEAAGSFTFS